MRANTLGQLAKTIPWAFAALLASIAMPAPIETITNEPTPQSVEQKQTERDSCRFLMDHVNGIILSLNPEGRITFLNHYGQSFFGYSAEEILGKPMLGTVTPLAGYEGRDLTDFCQGSYTIQIATPSVSMKTCCATASGSGYSGQTTEFPTNRERCAKFSGSV